MINQTDRSWRVKIKVKGRSLYGLVDTGAGKTILSRRRFPKLKVSNCPSKLRGAGGASIRVFGETTVPIRMGEFEYITPVVVADIESDALLGYDFLRDNKFAVDCGQGLLINQHVAYPMSNRASMIKSCQMVAVGRVTVLPGEETLVRVRPRGNRGLGWASAIASNPGKRRGVGLGVIPTLFNPSEVAASVMTINSHATAILINKGDVVARAEEFEYTKATPPQGGRATSPSRPFPEHLRCLLDNISKDCSAEQREVVAGLLTDYKDVFTTPGGDIGHTTMAEHHIDTGTARPVKQRPRRVPLAKRAAAEKELKNMLDKDLIEPSHSPWASPIVLVTKKDGTMRFCVDYRKLNDLTHKDAYPLPRIDGTLDKLSGNKWFTTLDLASGYWQVPLAQNSREQSAFCTEDGLYQFKVLPFGLCNAPSTFTRLMDKVLRKLVGKSCLVYLDDVVTFGKTFEEALGNLRIVFGRFREAGLTLKPSKCTLFQKEVSFLGHFVSADGVRCDPAKIEKVHAWTAPKCVKDVKSFLGLASYYRRFIKGFATIANPLTALTKKENKFIWSEKCQQAFDELKELLTNAPILVQPLHEGKYILDTDASNFGLGGVLSQVRPDGSEKVIGYASRTLSPAQRNYCATRRELLAVVEMTKQFRHYLLGAEFLLRVDHASLTWLLNFKEPEGMVARWIERLAEYPYVIQHRAGVKHGNADALSRCPDCQRAECDDAGVTDIWEVDDALLDELTAFQGLTLAEIRESQVADEELSPMIQLMETEVNLVDKPPGWFGWPLATKRLWHKRKWMRIVNGVLCKNRRDCRTGLIFPVIVVPVELRKLVLKQLHDAQMAAHPGIRRMLWSVQRRCYWPGMSEDVVRWIHQCEKCSRRKIAPQHGRHPLQHLPAGNSFERVAMDVLETGVISGTGNRYILVVADYFTKWVEAYALPNHRAETIAKVLVENWILRFGVMRYLVSDQGRDLDGKVMRAICELMGAEKMRTTPYRPQSDGLVERFNRSVLAMLSAYVSMTLTDWDDKLPFVMAAYRATAHSSTGFTPNSLVFGREIHLPLDIYFPMVTKPEHPACPNLYVEWLRRTLRFAHSVARKSLKGAARTQKSVYDKRSRERHFEVGQLVLYWYPPRARKKLSYGWCGPYVVLAKPGPVTYELQHLETNDTRVVHVDFMKHCLFKISEEAQEAYKKYLLPLGLNPEEIPAGGEHDANARPPPDAPEPDVPMEGNPLVDSGVADSQPQDYQNSEHVPVSPPRSGEDPEDVGPEQEESELPGTPEPPPRRTGRIGVPSTRFDPEVWKLH